VPDARLTWCTSPGSKINVLSISKRRRRKINARCHILRFYAFFTRFKGAPRNNRGAEFLASEEEGILNHDSRGGIGSVSKFAGQANITGGINSRICCLQVVIYYYAVLIVPHANGFKVQAFNVRRASNSDQNLIRRDDISFGRCGSHGVALPNAPVSRAAQSPQLPEPGKFAPGRCP